MASDKYESFRSFIRESLPSWSKIEDLQFEFEPLCGFTNEVYKITAKEPNIDPNPLIFRKFNENSKLLDRPLERKLFKELAEMGVGPKFYADNENYRLEEYIESKSLFGENYNQEKVRRELARAIANFHKIDIPWIGRKRILTDDLANPELCKIFEDKCDSNVFGEDDKEITKKIKEITSSKEREFLEKIVPVDDLAFSHNDLLDGNQLLKDGTGEVMLIDFEYAGKNFRGFDIGYMYVQAIYASHTEYPYFRVEERNYPSEEEFREFIEYYLVFSDMDKEEQRMKAESLIGKREELLGHVKGRYNVEEFEKRVNKLFRETKIGALTCAHYITTWATKMYKTNENEFGYFEFAKEGYKKYIQLKEEILKTL